MSDDLNEYGLLVPKRLAEALAAENARLKAEVERLTERNKFLEQIDSYLQDANQHSFEQRCNELEAEVERLRAASFVTAVPVEQYERVVRAGDDLACALAAFHIIHRGSIDSTKQEDLVKWNAAKEGKQSV